LLHINSKIIQIVKGEICQYVQRIELIAFFHGRIILCLKEHTIMQIINGMNNMQTVILCGGLGTRLREETEFRPKPMVNIGDRPILWHIMKIYAAYGYKDFVLALGL